MPNVTDSPRAGGFIVSEGNGTISRDPGTLIAGQNLKPGTVLGLITASTKYTQLAPGAVDGSEVAAGALYDAVDASAADADCVVLRRLSEWNDSELIWPDGITGPQKVTATGELEARNILLR